MDLTKGELQKISDANALNIHKYHEIFEEDTKIIMDLIKCNALFGKKTFDYCPIISGLLTSSSDDAGIKSLAKALKEQLNTLSFDVITTIDQYYKTQFTILRVSWDDPEPQINWPKTPIQFRERDFIY